MLEEQKNNPLHGVKLENLLTELVEHYGFEILAEQININCFKSNPSIKSSLKFLRKTPWARNKVEAFYLYKFVQLPLPSDTDHQFEPRERPIPLDQKVELPAEIKLGESEFFDDPASGPAFPSKKKVLETRSKAKSKAVKIELEKDSESGASPQGKTADPWANWREKNSQDDEG